MSRGVQIMPEDVVNRLENYRPQLLTAEQWRRGVLRSSRLHTQYVLTRSEMSLESPARSPGSLSTSSLGEWNRQSTLICFLVGSNATSHRICVLAAAVREGPS